MHLKERVIREPMAAADQSNPSLQKREHQMFICSDFIGELRCLESLREHFCFIRKF